MIVETILSIAAKFLGDALVASLREWLGARETRAAREDLDQTHERAGAAEAANETLDTIAGIANARADASNSVASPSDLVRRMRARAAGDRDAARSGRKDDGEDAGGQAGRDPANNR